MRHLMLLSLLVAAPALAGGWTVDRAQSSLRFSGNAQGEAFEGRFAKFDAGIAFDPADLPGSKFDVTIDLDSADTQNEERDGTLKQSDFFDVASHPRATFVATEFARTASGYEARGTLTLRGVARPVTLAFTWTAAGDGAQLNGRATLDRSAFGVGGGDWADPELIANEVEVTTALVLAPAH